jgi:hypothetical protein
MIRDAKGRKWYLRFKQYRNGWYWEAQCKGHGQSSGWNFFPTRALAETDARRCISTFDAIAASAEFIRLLQRRGSECRLTAADRKAIKRAGTAR